MPYIDRRSIEKHTASAVASPNFAVHFINGGSALTMTLVAPEANSVGQTMTLISGTAYAHVVTLSGGFGGDSNQTTFTMIAKVGAMITLVSDGDSWFAVDTRWGVFTGDSQSYAASGAIDPLYGYNLLTKAGVGAMTLAVPVVGQTGQRMAVYSTTAQAHTLTVTGGVGGVGAGGDVGTFGGAVGDGCELVAIDAIWYLVSTTNVTFA